VPAASGTHVDFDITDGLALSNAGPLAGTDPAMPLNDLVALPADQTLTVEIDRTHAHEVMGLVDLVLYVEYVADV
jgi:hypothetical protein